MDGVPRTTGVNSGRLDMYYISPDGKRMRSMSEVYSFLGLTAAPPKSSGPAPTAAHVAAAAAAAANSGRGVREAKLSASAAITGWFPRLAVYNTKTLPCLEFLIRPCSQLQPSLALHQATGFRGE